MSVFWTHNIMVFSIVGSQRIQWNESRKTTIKNMDYLWSLLNVDSPVWHNGADTFLEIMWIFTKYHFHNLLSCLSHVKNQSWILNLPFFLNLRQKLLIEIKNSRYNCLIYQKKINLQPYKINPWKIDWFRTHKIL